MNEAADTKCRDNRAAPIPVESEANNCDTYPNKGSMRDIIMMMVGFVINEIEPKHIEVREDRPQHPSRKSRFGYPSCASFEGNVRSGKVSNKHQLASLLMIKA